MILMKSYLLDTLDILYSANVFNLMSVLSTAFFLFFLTRLLCIILFLLISQILTFHKVVSYRSRLDGVNQVQDWKTGADVLVLHT